MTGTPDTALIAGTGLLPALLAKARPDLLICELEGFPSAVPGATPERFRVERLVPFLDGLVARGIETVVFAGAMQRPKLEPEFFDPQTASLVPRLLGAMQAGDDETLRAVIELFEEWGLRVVGAHEIASDLVPEAGILCGDVTEADRRDQARAAEIVAALGSVDVGQGAVVAQGLCLAVESLPGTDAMLAFAADHQGLRPDPKGAGGVFYKAPKPGQDRRIDLPAIGPQTVANAAKAGLSGIAWEAGGVMLLDREATVAAAQEAGLFLWACAP
ncbi:LpxI family protein [Pseudothioclava nitratireducens]|uniref:LpxI family protein n=1 Tax=Pseudothioclava nitratireducens TaxID=1928646 RepID=UPI0023DA9B59|nr:UDP-2,3-diacylglucosamine diphosphatase LpxI [Defluviimonas nitratireducens]MDF1621600.1 UDP-2,3-diacylglucosamine diphosphatase LpxI [Defluviimonas nitratireducens]